MIRDWPFVTLQEIAADVPYPIGDGDHGQIKPAMYTSSGVPYIRVADIGWGQFEPKGLVHIPKEVHEANLKSELRPGDILIAKTGATIGKCCVVPPDLTKANTTSSVGKISLDQSKLLPKFLLYWFLTPEFQKFLWSISTRAAQPGFNIADMKLFKVPLPPLADQQRIVRLLDEAFEKIAIAKANAEKNLQNAHALFESHLQSDLSLSRQRWETKNIGETCSFKRGLTYAKTDEVAASKTVVLRATNIDLATNHLVYGELKYISDAVIVPEDKTVKKDSLLICMASGSKSHLGKVAIIDEDSGYAFGGFMGMLTPSASLLPKYLFYLMTSGFYRTFIESISDGANINNLTFDKLSGFSFPVPPLSEQRRIVTELDMLESSTGRLAATYAAKLQAVDALQVSVLSQAFSGTLGRAA